MDLKHVEEMAEDKDIVKAYMVSCLMDFCADTEDYEFEDDIPKCWCELTDEEKEDMLNNVEYFWLKDCSNHSIDDVCETAMLYQNEIFADTLDKWEFMELLAERD